VYTRDRSTPPQNAFTTGCRFYALDSLVLLDSPGEYWINRSTARLYYLPAEPMTSDTDVVVSRLEVVVDVSGTSHVSFADLTMSDSRGDVLVSKHSASHLVVSGNTIRNAFGKCVSFDGGAPQYPLPSWSKNIVLEANIVSGCGAEGMSVMSGNRSSLESWNFSVVRNTIENVSRVVRTYTPAIRFNGVGLLIAGNRIAHTPHTAITGWGNEHVFEQNWVHHTCYASNDCGSFYVGRSWAEQGIVVRDNTFDTVRATERLGIGTAGSQQAMYLDDQFSGVDFYRNNIINATVGVMLSGGRRNLIHDNFFLNSVEQDIYFSPQGLTWQQKIAWENCSIAMGQGSCLVTELELFSYKLPPYAAAYPELPFIFEDHPGWPVGNVLADNTYCHAKSPDSVSFMNVQPDEVKRCLSVFSDNTEECHQLPGPASVSETVPAIRFKTDDRVTSLLAALSMLLMTTSGGQKVPAAASVGGPVSLQSCNARSTVMAWHAMTTSVTTTTSTLGLKAVDGCLTVSLPKACPWCHPPRSSPPADVGVDVRTQPCANNATAWTWSAASGQLLLTSNTSLCFGFRNNHGFWNGVTATLEPCAADPAAPGESVFTVGTGGELLHKASGLCLAGSIHPTANTFVGGHPCDKAFPDLLTARPWCDASKSIDQRAASLLAELKPHEKTCWFGGPSFTSGYGMIVTCGVPRLNISSFEWWHEAIHGVKSTNVKNTSPKGAETSFPMPIGFAGSFNRTLIHAVGAAIGDEARAVTRPFDGGTKFWAPNVNTVHDPLWGISLPVLHFDVHACQLISVACPRSVGKRRLAKILI
jgi:hypothetical protein